MDTLAHKSRLCFLDSLRGIAALMVAYFHYSRYFLQEGFVVGGFEYEIFNFFNNYVDLGKVGVVIFFAISGMVIPFSLLNKERRPIRKFLISRFFRLYPIYWCSIPVGVFSYWFLQGEDISFLTIISNFTMLQQFFFIDNVMGLYWTLQIELIFYGLCVVLFLWGWLDNPDRVFIITVLFVVLSIVAAWFRYYLQIKVPVALFLALSFMFWGTLWREYIINGDFVCKRYALTIFFLLVLFMPIISLLAYNINMGFSEAWYRYVLSYYTAMLILIFFTTKVHIHGVIFSWLGRISYSVYLFHGAVFVLYVNYFGERFFSLYGFSAHVYIFVCMLLTVFVSVVSYMYIERPMIALGKKIVRDSFSFSNVLKKIKGGV